MALIPPTNADNYKNVINNTVTIIEGNGTNFNQIVHTTTKDSIVVVLGNSLKSFDGAGDVVNVTFIKDGITYNNLTNNTYNYMNVSNTAVTALPNGFVMLMNVANPEDNQMVVGNLVPAGTDVVISVASAVSVGEYAVFSVIELEPYAVSFNAVR